MKNDNTNNDTKIINFKNNLLIDDDNEVTGTLNDEYRKLRNELLPPLTIPDWVERIDDDEKRFLRFLAIHENIRGTKNFPLYIFNEIQTHRVFLDTLDASQIRPNVGTLAYFHRSMIGWAFLHCATIINKEEDMIFVYYRQPKFNMVIRTLKLYMKEYEFKMNYEIPKIYWDMINDISAGKVNYLDCVIINPDDTED